MNAEEIRAQVRALGDEERARVVRRFFKTGPGEYGAGDIFLGARVPEVRRLARECAGAPRAEVRSLLRSPVHEERLLALLILLRGFARGDEAERGRIHRLYLGHTRYVNNWDLVDVSAPHLVGAHLRDKSRAVLDRLAASGLLWERRIAIMATFDFIRRGDFADTLRISRRLLADGEDLIHKAVGWMLREVGKRDRAAAAAFLREHHRRMPRVMLRYAIEHLPEAERRGYLARGRAGG